MGEYWKPVNVTRMECLHPHRFGNGLKWVEWTERSRVLDELNKLIAGPWKDDVVIIASDYGQMRAFHGDVSKIPMSIDGGAFYMAAVDISEVVKAGTYQPGPVVDAKAIVAAHKEREGSEGEDE